MKIHFPDPRTADEHGIVCVGGELSPENVLLAYEKGIFPWPHDNMPLLWFSPLARGILDFSKFHVPKSVSKILKKKNYHITIDQAFLKVIHECGTQKREKQKGSWITKDLISTYTRLHERGVAHSVECWLGGELVGGLYGVYVKGVFSGESMFFKDSGASKACLVALVEKLKSMGHTWFDIQMVTPVLDLFGGEYISQDEFLKKLHSQQKHNLPWL